MEQQPSKSLLEHEGYEEPNAEQLHTLLFLWYIGNVINKIEASQNGSPAHSIRLGMPSINNSALQDAWRSFPTMIDDFYDLVKKPNTWMQVELAKIRATETCFISALSSTWFLQAFLPTNQSAGLPSVLQCNMTLLQVGFIHSSSRDHTLKMLEDLQSHGCWHSSY